MSQVGKRRRRCARKREAGARTDEARFAGTSERDERRRPRSFLRPRRHRRRAGRSCRGVARRARRRLPPSCSTRIPVSAARSIAASRSTPVTNRAILGEDYWAGEALASEAKASGALIVNGATVWSLDPERVVGVSIAGKARLIEARRVIIATGSQERPFPIPGWTLPGVMTAGAAQTVLKAQGLLPDGRTVMAGTGPLMWLLAAQILRAGGKIAAILDTTPRRNLLRAAPHLRRLHAVAVFRQGPGAAARGEGKGAGPSGGERRGRRRRQAQRGRVRPRPHAGRSPAAAPGRRAQRQPRPRCRRGT